MTEFPFLFYGSRPRDWFEGANLGHRYEIRFHTAPSADLQRRLGELWAQQTLRGAVEPGLWLWSGAWALVQVGERRISEQDAFFRKMAALLRAVDELAPIAEVVFWGARDVTDEPWEAWTLAHQPVPTPGPPVPGLAPLSWYHQQRDASLPAAEPSPAFQEGYNGAELEDDAGAEDEPPPPIATAAPADLDGAIAAIEAFLKAYTLRTEYFDDGEPRVWMQYTSGNRPRTAVEVMFCCAADPEDAELVALCEKAITAARASHPQLGFEIDWSLSD